MEKIREKIEEMIMKAIEKNDLSKVEVLLELRLTVARVFSHESR